MEAVSKVENGFTTEFTGLTAVRQSGGGSKNTKEFNFNTLDFCDLCDFFEFLWFKAF